MSIECIRLSAKKHEADEEILLKLYDTESGVRSTAFIRLEKHEALNLVKELEAEINK